MSDTETNGNGKGLFGNNQRCLQSCNVRYFRQNSAVAKPSDGMT